MKCRHCHAQLNQVFADLGSSPPSNSYITAGNLLQPETFFPLLVYVCEKCWLVQTADFASREELFTSDYSYFSSYSTTFIEHARNYAEKMQDMLSLDEYSQVVEVASNDGYLLQFFQERNIPNLGIEPTESTARLARERGISTLSEFFGVDLAKRLAAEGMRANLMAANNVLAHVPDINDFLSGFTLLLADDGIVTFEFPHLLSLLDKTAFDTIYHEHYSYLSLLAVEAVFRTNGLGLLDVETINTHGGSLRVYGQKIQGGSRQRTSRVDNLLAEEISAGVNSADYYVNFQERVIELKNRFLLFLLENREKIVVGYGAAAKANTLINFAGVRPDLIRFVADRNPNKYGKFLPGSKIPILEESEIKRCKPDFIIIFPWNIKQEIMQQLEYTREWGARFVTFFPETDIF
jgi:hypothetical protein